jgi:hypothetical protein
VPVLGRYTVLMIFHAGFELQAVLLPSAPAGQHWYRVVDTHLPDGQDIVEPAQEVALDPADRYLVNPRSTVVLLARKPGRRAGDA